MKSETGKPFSRKIMYAKVTSKSGTAPTAYIPQQSQQTPYRSPVFMVKLSAKAEYGDNRVIPCQITPPDFDKNLHIWSIWSEKKISQIIEYLVKYFPRYGPLKFC